MNPNPQQKQDDEFTPILPKDFDISKVEFTQVKTMPSGAKLIFMTYEGGPIHLQSPEMKITWDPQVFQDDTKNVKYNMKASVNPSASRTSKIFHDKMIEFDTMLKKSAEENSVEWFKKKNVSADVIESMITPTIRDHIDVETGEPSGRYPPTFGFKIRKKDDKIQCGCFNGSVRLNEGEKAPKYNFNDKSKDDYTEFDNYIKKNTLIKGIFQAEFVWINPGKFGFSWSAHQLRIKVPKNFDEYAFMEDSDEEQEAEKLAQGNFVDTDSDNSEDGEVVPSEGSSD